MLLGGKSLGAGRDRHPALSACVTPWTIPRHVGFALAAASLGRVSEQLETPPLLVGHVARATRLFAIAFPGDSSRELGRAPRATLGPTTERRFSRRRETSMRSVAFSQQGGAEHRRHQQTIAKTELVLKRESHGIVVQLAAVAQQPNPREPQKYD